MTSDSALPTPLSMEEARSVQMLWPFLAPSPRTPVRRWSVTTPERSVDAMLVSGSDLRRGGVSLRQAAADVHRQLKPGAAAGWLAPNPWRLAATGAPWRGRPSWPALWRAMRDAGFENLGVYAASPSCENPYTFEAGRWAATWAPAVLVYGHRPGPRPTTLLDRLPQQLKAAAACSRDVRLRKVMCSGKDKTLAVLGDGRTTWLARIPWSDGVLDAERRAHGLLAALSRRPALAGRVPPAIGHANIHGQAVFFEGWLSGQPLASHLRPDSRGRWAAEAASFLAGLNPTPGPAAGDLMARFGRPALDALSSHLADADALSALRSVLDRSLVGVRARTGLVHGDFGTRNVLVLQDGISGVIDWENARADAPLVMDLMNYLDSAQRRTDRGQTLADTVPALAMGRWPQADEAALLRESLEAGGGTGEGGLLGLALIYWLNHVTPQLGMSSRNRADRERFDTVLRWAVQRTQTCVS